MPTEPADRDVAAFDRRASTYDRGGLGAWHQLIAQRTADVALAAHPQPRTVLDVGCGTGALLAAVGERVPDAHLVGLDPAAGMTTVVRDRLTGRSAATVARSVAEHLPVRDSCVDLVVSTMSFDHWRDQRAGAAELARVVRPGGHVVLVDLCAAWLPAKPGRIRRPRDVAGLLTGAGLRIEHRSDVYRLAAVVPLVRAHVATP